VHTIFLNGGKHLLLKNLWLVLEDKIATKVNLVKRGIQWRIVFAVCVGRKKKQRHIYFVCACSLVGVDKML